MKMKRTKIFTLVLAALLALSLLSGCGNSTAKDNGSKAADEKQIKATLTVVYEDKTTKDYELTAKPGETLGDAIYAAKLISQQEYNDGYVTEIDGTIADYNKEQAWWCLQDKDGKQLSVGIKDTKLSDGDVYKFVYTIGF
jgi:DNA-dependent RNA polymerase auxiliary subunit epsilon